ncbi:hypothetical protein P5673_017629 [Acropora cervicornis]|uniref:Uncharacterized protein n=1 Tax=Acropora cervicornis TaxID=6130 RepID=A0AAD9QDY7_ACRCE|nr:hypothetical protein P5673_017629 [Acropora cervicornis]
MKHTRPQEVSHRGMDKANAHVSLFNDQQLLVERETTTTHFLSYCFVNDFEVDVKGEVEAMIPPCLTSSAGGGGVF